MAKPIIITITGPSGFNKSHMIKHMTSKYNHLKRIISHTDRPKRDDETDGENFYFVSSDEFDNMVETSEFVEWQRIPSSGHRYGKTKLILNQFIADNTDCVLITKVNVINLPVFKRHYPESISIFIDEKDSISIISKLKEDKSILDESEFERRLKIVTEERRRRHLADHIISSKDNMEETVMEVMKIIAKFR